ncbi:hypothetical protein [Thiolinea disciformis]|uniref:hypothetical protein n=1 Tax=Thiolinea disciformis TaxID=125614 RepID=UPI00038284B1|nr:hypothetical protein [Thiolinea disciformis]
MLIQQVPKAYVRPSTPDEIRQASLLSAYQNPRYPANDPRSFVNPELGAWTVELDRTPAGSKSFHAKLTPKGVVAYTKISNNPYYDEWAPAAWFYQPQLAPLLKCQLGRII